MQPETLKYITAAEAADKFQQDKHELSHWVDESTDGTIILQRKHFDHAGDFVGRFQIIKNTRVWDETGMVRLAFSKLPRL